MIDGQRENRVFLVTGATGRQGGAAARHLIERGFRVRALTRNPDGPTARALAASGAEVVRGDLDDRPSVDRAAEGVYGVFALVNFWETGYEREVRQGVTLVDAAKAAGAGHLVYSSVGSSYRGTGIPHFDSKWEIEEHVRASGLPHTILRPTSLMEDWEEMREEIVGGTLAQPMDPEKPLQQVSADDVGAFAAMAFEDPARWIGRELDLAGDESSMREIAGTFARVIGRRVDYERVPWEEFREAYGEEMTVMYEWFDSVGYEADIAALREEYPSLTTFEDYLLRHGWKDAAVPEKVSAPDVLA